VEAAVAVPDREEEVAQVVAAVAEPRLAEAAVLVEVAATYQVVRRCRLESPTQFAKAHSETKRP